MTPPPPYSSKCSHEAPTERRDGGWNGRVNVSSFNYAGTMSSVSRAAAKGYTNCIKKWKQEMRAKLFSYLPQFLMNKCMLSERPSVFKWRRGTFFQVECLFAPFPSFFIHLLRHPQPLPLLGPRDRWSSAPLC